MSILKELVEMAVTLSFPSLFLKLDEKLPTYLI